MLDVAPQAIGMNLNPFNRCALLNAVLKVRDVFHHLRVGYLRHLESPVNRVVNIVPVAWFDFVTKAFSPLNHLFGNVVLPVWSCA